MEVRKAKTQFRELFLAEQDFHLLEWFSLCLQVSAVSHPQSLSIRCPTPGPNPPRTPASRSVEDSAVILLESEWLHSLLFLHSKVTQINYKCFRVFLTLTNDWTSLNALKNSTDQTCLHIVLTEKVEYIKKRFQILALQTF